MKRLDGKTCVVTGGANGIGKATCFRLAEEGARVAITDIEDSHGEDLRDEIVGRGGTAEYWHLDVADEDAVERVFGEVADRLGEIDVVVNNAGISGADKPTDEITSGEWRQVMDVNVNGVFYCTKAAIPHLRQNGGGSIVNLSSIYGIIGAPDIPPYHASKGAVREMSKTDAVLYAKENIRVNSVHPGFIWTPLVAAMAEASEDGPEAFRAHLDGLHPVGHVGEPDEFPTDAGLTHQVRFLLNYAVLAPSGHNSQPWLFLIRGARIDVLADRSRRLPVVDPEDRELTMSCAAAAETFVLAALAFGLGAELTALPEGTGSDVIARIVVAPGAGVPHSRSILETIRLRRTTRTAFEPDPLPDGIRTTCATAAKAHGVSVVFAGDGATHNDIADLVAEGDRHQFDDPEFRRELAHWIRPRTSPGRDGMSGAAFGMPDALSGVGAFMIRTFDIGGMAASGDVRKIREGSPLFMALATADDAPVDWVATGCALVDVLTTLSAEGWTASYLNQPIEVPELRLRLEAVLGIDGDPQLLLRVGRCDRPDPAPRRPVHDVMVS